MSFFYLFIFTAIFKDINKILFHLLIRFKVEPGSVSQTQSSTISVSFIKQSDVFLQMEHWLHAFLTTHGVQRQIGRIPGCAPRLIRDLVTRCFSIFKTHAHVGLVASPTLVDVLEKESHKSPIYYCLKKCNASAVCVQGNFSVSA